MCPTSTRRPQPRLTRSPGSAGRTLDALAYLGGLGLPRRRRPPGARPPAATTTAAGSVGRGELSWMLRLGLPLVALVHVGIGSFLSMQSYFGGTFVEGTGAVVGVGLIRNVAPLMAGLTLAGLLAARVTPELAPGARSTEATRVGPSPRTARGATAAGRRPRRGVGRRAARRGDGRRGGAQRLGCRPSARSSAGR